MSTFTDGVLIAGCWVLAYYLRFFMGPVPAYLGIPPLEPYLYLLGPIVVVWAVAFRAFDLYRPRRLGSHLSEWVDVAKASSLGCLVLVAIIEFFFRSHDYSRLVIVYFWLLSIITVSSPSASIKAFNPWRTTS